MNVGVLGISFKTASFVLRESLAKSVQQLSFLKEEPFVILETCNRLEIYFSSSDLHKTKIDLQSLFENKIGHSLGSNCYFYYNWSCFLHLCLVSSGLDSAVLGETEILRQVKSSYLRSCQSLYKLPSHLHYAFQKAFRVAKCNRHQFALEKKMPSLLNVLWQIISKLLDIQKSLRILLVGYSEIHRSFCSFLNYKNIHEIHFCSRNRSAMKSVKKIIPREDLSCWVEYDVISCATVSDTYLIEGKSDKKQVLFDLSMPRVIHPEVGGEEVFLFNLEQINAIFEQHKIQWQGLYENASLSLKEHAERLFHLYEKNDADHKKIAF